MLHRNFINSIIWRIFQIASTTLFQFLTFFILAKWLQPEGFGLFSLTMAIISLFGLFADFGITESSSKFVAENLATENGIPKSVIKAGAILSLVLGLTVSAICLLSANSIANWQGYDELAGLLKAGTLLIIFININVLGDGIFRGAQDFKSPAIINIVVRPLQLLSIVLLVKLNYGVEGAVWGLTLGFGLSAAISLGIVYLHIYRPVKEKLEIGVALKKVFFYSLPIGISSFSYFLYTRVDIILLGYFSGTVQVANYNVADRIYQLPLMLVSAFVIVLAPIVTREYARGNYNKLQEIFARSESFMFFLMIPISIAIFVLSGPVIRWLLPSYQESVVLLRILAPLIILKGIGGVATGGFLVSTGNAGMLAKITLFGAFLNLVFDLLLIPRYGAIGAMITTTVIHSFTIVLSICYLLSKLKLRLRIVPIGFSRDIWGDKQLKQENGQKNVFK